MKRGTSLPDKFEILVPIAIEMGFREGAITHGNLQRYLHISFQLSSKLIDFLEYKEAIYKENDKPLWKINELEATLLLDEIIHDREWEKYTSLPKIDREKAKKLLELN